MNKGMAGRIHLFQRFAIALRENEMAGVAVACLDRILTVRRDMFTIVAAETSVPILMADEIRMTTPVGFHFREKICAMNGEGFIDDAFALDWLGKSGVQFVGNPFFRLGPRSVRLDQ